MDRHTNAALTFHESDADPATLAKCADAYRRRIGQEPPPPIIEPRKPAGVVVRYPLPDVQGITPQEYAALPLFGGGG